MSPTEKKKLKRFFFFFLCCLVISVHIEADRHLFVKLIKKNKTSFEWICKSPNSSSYSESLICVCGLNCKSLLNLWHREAGPGECFQVCVWIRIRIGSVEDQAEQDLKLRCASLWERTVLFALLYYRIKTALLTSSFFLFPSLFMAIKLPSPSSSSHQNQNVFDFRGVGGGGVGSSFLFFLPNERRIKNKARSVLLLFISVRGSLIYSFC